MPSLKVDSGRGEYNLTSPSNLQEGGYLMTDLHDAKKNKLEIKDDKGGGNQKPSKKRKSLQTPSHSNLVESQDENLNHINDDEPKIIQNDEDEPREIENDDVTLDEPEIKSSAGRNDDDSYDEQQCTIMQAYHDNLTSNHHQ